MEDEKLATALRTVISKMVRKLRKHMKDVDSLSISEIDTLSFLYQNDQLSPSELADMNKIKGQSMSDVLTHLQELGMIDKKKSTTDKRKFIVSLTVYGRQVVEQTRYEREKWLSGAIKQQLSSKEKKLLEEAIGFIERLINFD